MQYGLEGGSNEDRLSRELESLVERSVAAYCKDESFGRLGAFLSGGTDSSTVVGMMARMERGPVKAFSIGYREQSFNELEYAEIAARKFKADHHTHLVGPEECVEALPQMVHVFFRRTVRQLIRHLDLLLCAARGRQWIENSTRRRWWRRIIWRKREIRDRQSL